MSTLLEKAKQHPVGGKKTISVFTREEAQVVAAVCAGEISHVQARAVFGSRCEEGSYGQWLRSALYTCVKNGLIKVSA